MGNLPKVMTILAIAAVLVFSLGIQVGSAGPASFAFPESHRIFLGSASIGANSLASISSSSSLEAEVGANIRVNDPQSVPFGRSETTIAVDNEGENMVVGWNDAEGFAFAPFGPPPGLGLSGFGFSSDGGETFTDGGAPPAGVSGGLEFVTRGDPSLAIMEVDDDVEDALEVDDDEVFYFANLAMFTDPAAATNPFFDEGVSVYIGSFDDEEFSWVHSVLLQSPNYPFDLFDKEHIATDPDDDRPHVYVTVTNFIEVGGIPFFGFGQIEAYSSTDGGLTWGRGIIQPDETISVAFNEGIISQGSAPAVGPDGTVYTAWERGLVFPLFGQFGAIPGPQIRVASSADNGATWTPAAAGPPSTGANPAGTLVSQICSTFFFPPTGYNRGFTNDFPRITVIQDGDHAGRVIVTWQDCRTANGGVQGAPGAGLFGHPDADVYTSFSDDGGATWSAPTLVAGGGDGLIQFWPTVSADEDGDFVAITYYESQEVQVTPDPEDIECTVFLGFDPDDEPIFRLSTVSSLVDLFLAVSTDGGATFEAPVRVTDVTTNWCATATDLTPNFGDYNTAVSVKDEVFATWADGRNGVPDTFFARIELDD